MKSASSLFSLLSLSVCTLTACTNNPRTVDEPKTAAVVNDNKVQEQAAAENYSQLTQIADLLIQEVQLGEMAQTSSANTSVKKTAAELKRSAEAMYNELSALAQAKAIILPELPGTTGTAFVKKMENLKGASFDSEYTTITAADHQQLLSLLQSTAAGSNDADIRDWANKALSVLQQTHVTAMQ